MYCKKTNKQTNKQTDNGRARCFRNVSRFIDDLTALNIEESLKETFMKFNHLA